MHSKSYHAMVGASTGLTLPSRRFSHHVFRIMMSAFDRASPSSWIRTHIWRYQSLSRFSQKADRSRGGYSILPPVDDYGRRHLIRLRRDGAHNVNQYFRSFGGQSIVPWELALFLIEEMKGEGVAPGAVVYTSALAECRWASQSQHVKYLMDQMEAEGLQIVPGIPGATDNELPPSQMLEVLRSPSSSTTPSMRTQAAIRAAESALATVEAMWAGGKDEPSTETCRAALEACAAGGQWERALSLVRDSATVCAAKTTTRGEASATLTVQVELLARDGKWDEALALLQPEANMPGTR